MMKVAKNPQSGLFEVLGDDDYPVNSFHCEPDAQAWMDREIQKKEKIASSATAAALDFQEAIVKTPLHRFFATFIND
jgi:hypothetical protein